jgi:hypothetical protein
MGETGQAKALTQSISQSGYPDRGVVPGWGISLHRISGLGGSA